VPCGPIYSIDQRCSRTRKFSSIAQDVPNAEGPHIRLVGQPVTLSRTPSKMVARPPEFGEQADEVLAEFGFPATGCVTTGVGYPLFADKKTETALGIAKYVPTIFCPPTASGNTCMTGPTGRLFGNNVATESLVGLRRTQS